MTVGSSVKIKKIIVVSVILMLVLSIVMQAAGHVRADDRKTVRIGWHEPPYFIKDKDGRSSGYSYDYQMKVAACRRDLD